MFEPVAFGSGGYETSGGGAIHIISTAINIDGDISSNGAPGEGQTGAGGSLWLQSSIISGIGTVSASGGDSISGSSGGGGRIVMSYDTLISPVIAIASGGNVMANSNPYMIGSVGTVSILYAGSRTIGLVSCVGGSKQLTPLPCNGSCNYDFLLMDYCSVALSISPSNYTIGSIISSSGTATLYIGSVDGAQVHVTVQGVINSGTVQVCHQATLEFSSSTVFSSVFNPNLVFSVYLKSSPSHINKLASKHSLDLS